MDITIFNNSVTLVTLLIDGLFAILALVLIKQVFTKQSSRLIIPFFISTFSIAVLLIFYLSNTLTITNVWLNSHESTPLLYKIAGIWGNHEGSMLLFYTFMTAWTALLLRYTEAVRLSSFILLAIGGYIYFQANPFEILAIKTIAGQDLNPALQNPYLAIHPPILYAGQTLCFVLWVWSCTTTTEHLRVHFYTRVCFGLITLGLVLGARWAYGELGWGGFWFWDPVETVSLFPWLAIAAAVHTNKNNPSIHRTCLLISFPMVMLGLTLVRSGVLVSVHSFGFDIYNGIWLGFCTLVVCAISAIVFYKQKLSSFSLLTFQKIIPVGFLSILGILCALILVPVILKTCLTIDLAIDENFFHLYINPCLLILLVFTSFAPLMKIHWWSFLCAILCTVSWCLVIQPHFHLLASCAAFVGFWLIFSTINSIKCVFTKGFVAAHLGVGLCILGASHGETFTIQQEFIVSSLPKKFASYPIHYQSQKLLETLQVSKEILIFNIDNQLLAPQRQHFHISHTIKHQPSWTRINLNHIHATIFSENNTWKVELMLKPYISLFWLGIFFILTGIAISILNFKQNNTRLHK